MFTGIIVSAFIACPAFVKVPTSGDGYKLIPLDNIEIVHKFETEGFGHQMYIDLIKCEDDCDRIRVNPEDEESVSETLLCGQNRNDKNQ